MKTIPYRIAILLSLSVLFACKSKPSSSAANTTPVDTPKKTIANVLDPRDTDFDGPGIDADYKSKAIDTLYVTSRDGAEEKDRPYINSKTVLERDMSDPWNHGTIKPPLKFEFGHALVVLEKTNGWLGVLESITRRTKDKGQAWLTSGWEKVYVQESKTGKITDVKISPEELRAIAPDDGDAVGHPKVYLKGYLDLQLIDKSEYEDKKATAINYLDEDTATIKKKDGVIKLPCQKNIVRYTDDTTQGDNYTIYNYVGQFPLVNQYVVRGEYDGIESGDFNLIDKTTGVATSIESYPYVSNDRKYVVCVTQQGEDNLIANLGLYKISETGIKTILNVNFEYWMPTDDEKAIFFAADGCLYVPVAYANIANEKNAYFQYLKITIL